MATIAERVKKIIVDKLGVEESQVTSEASFTTDLGADSLDTVELIMEFEKEFNISIPDEQAETNTIVGQARIPRKDSSLNFIYAAPQGCSYRHGRFNANRK